MSSRRDSIQEDVPEKRSVALQPLSAAPTISFAAPSHVQKASSCIPNTAWGVKGSAEHPSLVKTRSTGTTTSSIQATRWRVHQELSEIPTEHLLVKTNAYLKEANPQVIADRICGAFRALSITIDTEAFEGEQNAILAETPAGVKFSVRLFKHEDRTVVVVRRHKGCSLDFRDAAESVLRSAGGLPLKRRKQLRRFSCPPAGDLPKTSPEALRRKLVRDDFQVAYGMLRSNKLDSQVLALESMEKMTTDSRESAAKDAAAQVLSSSECLDQLVSLLDGHRGVENASSLLSRKVFAVLANSCGAVGEAALADLLSAGGSALKSKQFLSLLLSFLRDAPLMPHEAFHASRCLRSLLVSSEVELAVNEMSAIDVVLSAHSAGVEFRHEALGRECSEIMVQLQKGCC